MQYRTMGTATGITVWCYMNEYNLSVPYKPELSAALEDAFSKGKTHIQISLTGSKFSTFQVDFTAMKETDYALGTSRSVNRLTLGMHTTLARGFLWEFESSPGEWSCYDLGTQDEIDNTFTHPFACMIDLTQCSPPLPYVINTTSMIQTRINTGTNRPIRRIPLNHPYTPAYGHNLNGSTFPLTKSASTPVSNGQGCSLLKSGSIVSGVVPTVPSPTSIAPAVTESLPNSSRFALSKMTNCRHKSMSGVQVLDKYMETVTADLDQEDCCICYDKLSEPSSYGEGSDAQIAVKLTGCGHLFHKLCILEMYKSSHKGNSLQCPRCNFIYGEKLGNCPAGTMTWSLLHNLTLPGYEGHGSIQIQYFIKGGIQGANHPNPGERFTCRGFPRTGFLPDTNEGRKILKLLIVAFQRRLMFTIGQSTTTGEENTVTWNEIHHKTNPRSNSGGHGYPDPGYLLNVRLELASHGVTEEDLV